MIERFNPHQEQAPVKIEFATIDDWEKCKELRLLEISGDYSEMFGYITEEELEQEKNKTKEEWQNDILSQDKIFVLPKTQTEYAGFGRAIKKSKTDTIWRLQWDYVKREFRGQGIQKKMIALRLKEILKRGGTEADAGFIAWNQKSLNNYKSFGFEVSQVHMKNSKVPSPEPVIYIAKIDLSNPAVIKKIQDFVI